MMNKIFLLAILLLSGPAMCYTYDTYSNTFTSEKLSSVKISTKNVNYTHFKLDAEIEAKTLAAITTDICLVVSFGAKSMTNWVDSDALLVSIERSTKTLTFRRGVGYTIRGSGYESTIGADPSSKSWMLVKEVVAIDPLLADPSYTVSTTSDSVSAKIEVTRRYETTDSNSKLVMAPFQLGYTPVAVNLYSVACPSSATPFVFNTDVNLLVGGYSTEGLKPSATMTSLLLVFTFSISSITALMAL